MNTQRDLKIAKAMGIELVEHWETDYIEHIKQWIIKPYEGQLSTYNVVWNTSDPKILQMIINHFINLDYQIKIWITKGLCIADIMKSVTIEDLKNNKEPVLFSAKDKSWEIAFLMAVEHLIDNQTKQP